MLEATPDHAKVVAFASDYLDALHAAKLAFAEVARGNLRKARGAFIAPGQRIWSISTQNLELKSSYPGRLESASTNGAAAGAISVERGIHWRSFDRQYR